MTNDAHNFYLESIFYLNDFKNKPSFYLQEWLFNWGDISAHLNFFHPYSARYWSDIGRLMHTKFMVLSNILSFGNEYVNVIFYNVIYFLGQIALLKSFNFFQPKKKWLFVLIIFALPGISFWCSGIHKDGFVLAFIGFVSWFTIKAYTQKTLKSYFLLALSLLCLLGIRYFYFLCFVPMYFAFWLSHWNKRALLTFILTLSIGCLVFFNAQHISPKVNFMELVVSKQQSFFNSKGYSDMFTPLLEATPQSFIKRLYVAVDHIFLEPIPKFGEKIKYDMAAVDSFLILLIIFFSIFYVRRKRFSNPYYLLMSSFAILVLLFIGYTIPNLGALVRYKSPFVLILLLCVVSMSDNPLFRKLESK